MKKIFALLKKIVPNRGNAIIFLTAVFLNLVIWVAMSYIKLPDDLPLPLHYNIYQGIDVFDTWSKLYVIPIVGLVFIVINYILSVLIIEKDKLMAYFLSSSSIFVQLILGMAVFWIFYLQKDLFY